MKPLLELTGVSKRYRQKRDGAPVVIFDGFNLSIAGNSAGEIVVLLGASGDGKTTLLNLISGLVLPDKGVIRALGDRVVGPNPHSVLVSQTYTCFPWLSAIKNVEFGLALRGVPPRERQVLASQYLAKVGLSERMNAFPSELSGGMQQRVAIARTLVLHPPIVLMDEPFGALDSLTRTKMQQLLLELWEQEKNFILFVTHDIQEALLLADRIFVLPPRPVKKVIAEVRVPFARPRSPTLIYEPAFTALARELRQVLDPMHTD